MKHNPLSVAVAVALGLYLFPAHAAENYISSQTSRGTAHVGATAMCRKDSTVVDVRAMVGSDNISVSTTQIRGRCSDDPVALCAGGAADAFRNNNDAYSVTVEVTCRRE